MEAIAKRNSEIVLALIVIAALTAVGGAALLHDGDAADAAATTLNERTATLEYAEGVTWRVNNMVFTNPGRVTDFDCVLPYGTPITVWVSVNAGYEGTPVLRANGNPYTAGEPYKLMVDTRFTASGVYFIPPKTEYIVNGEAYKTVYRNMTDPVPLQVLHAEERADITIKGWNNDPQLKGEWLGGEKNVYPGDKGWEKVYADFEFKKYAVSFYPTPGLTWNCNGVNQSGGAAIQVEYGKSVSVTAVVQSGYWGIPVLRVNNAAYTSGTPYKVTGDASFTASGVQSGSPPKTDYIVNGEVYKTVYRNMTDPVPLQVLNGEERTDVTIKGWNNDPQLRGRWLNDQSDVYPGDEGWEKVYADFVFKKYTVTFYSLPGLAWVCNGLKQKDGATLQIEHGKTVSVTGTIQAGYEGTPVLKANDVVYLSGTAYRVTGDVSFKASGVKEIPVKTCYVTLKYTKGVIWNIEKVTFNNPTSDWVCEFTSGTVIKVQATADDGYEGTPIIWVNNSPYKSGTNYTVTENVSFAATGVKKTGTYTVVLHAGDGGKVEGAGSYTESTTATIRAVPDEGFVFVEWSDGNKDKERNIDSERILTAIFAAAPEEDDHSADSVALAAMALAAIAALGVMIWVIRIRIL